MTIKLWMTVEKGGFPVGKLQSVLAKRTQYNISAKQIFRLQSYPVKNIKEKKKSNSKTNKC